MEDLVYCCPQCLQLSRTGIVTDLATIMRSQRRPIFVRCEACGQFNCVMIEDALLTASLDPAGHFIPLDELQTVSSAVEELAA